MKGKPTNTYFGDRIKNEWLSNSKSDLSYEDHIIAGTVKSFHESENSHKRGSDPDPDPDAPCVNNIGCRDRYKKIDDHKDQRKEVDLHGGYFVKCDRLTGNGRKGDPLHLHQCVDDKECKKHNPSIAINLNA